MVVNNKIVLNRWVRCLFLLGIFALIIYLFLHSFFSIQSIKGGELISSVDSPDNKYTVTTFLNNGGATTAFAVLGVVTNNQTGREKNIYWQYRCQEGTIAWESNTVVIINGIRLDVEKDIYDYRKYE